MKIGRQGTAFQLPMLIGSNELEIEPFLEKIRNLPIQRSIHLGAANGYFAVGFARTFWHTVLAFEAGSANHRELQAIIRSNGMSDRVVCRPAANYQDLDAEIGPEPAMIFCDIDGGEQKLLDPDLIPKLREVPMLVETHPLDGAAGYSRDLLRKRFSETHIIEEAVMKSRFCHEMVQFADSADSFRLKGLENEILSAALEERRTENSWLWMIPKKSEGLA